ncbi:MAG: AMP-binding protein [Acidimicrobiales bacterium]
MTTEPVPFGVRCGRLAREMPPTAVAIVFVPEVGDERQVTWSEFDERSTQLARACARDGVRHSDLVAIQMKNSPEFLFSIFACWKLGAVPVLVRWDLPDWELQRLHDVIRPKVLITADRRDLFEASRAEPTDPLPPADPPYSSGICSSGSTGTPKIILRRAPLRFAGTGSSITVIENFEAVNPAQIILVPSPLYHNNGFVAANDLLVGHKIVLMERFDAARAVDLIERHRATGFTAATPIFQRIARVDGIEQRDLSSLEWVMQGAAQIPAWVAQFWFDRIGAEHVYLSYGASEGIGTTVCRGDEWLAHPGTVGRGVFGTRVRILDEDGTDLPVGEIGDIYVRSARGINHEYLGDVPPTRVTPDGFATIGDVGWVDDDGYLYIADRRTDMIVTGGVNVYPAEVEAALSEHQQIADVVVIGLKDDDWGHRVHAVVQRTSESSSLSAGDVIAFAKARVSGYKVPKTVEFVDKIPRSEATKVSRSALIAERELQPNDAG